MWELGKIRKYSPISGGCFMCLYDKEHPCKFRSSRLEQKKAVDMLAALSGDKMDKRLELTSEHLRQLANYLDDPEDLEQMDISYFTAEEVVKLLNDELISFVIQEPRGK